ncbi:hypothetical protein [Halobacillus litoralis]|uniref:hypothetical protein n=1 Tax=Halobacillus litoralis TaxID=45668 RepID=UPI001F46192F|nr:hypothetical protein [Halobacillus litoralis]
MDGKGKDSIKKELTVYSQLFLYKLFSFLPPGAKAPSLSADERPSSLAKPTLGDLGPLVLPQEWKGHRSLGVL